MSEPKPLIDTNTLIGLEDNNEIDKRPSSRAVAFPRAEHRS